MADDYGCKCEWPNLYSTLENTYFDLTEMDWADDKYIYPLRTGASRRMLPFAHDFNDAEQLREHIERIVPESSISELVIEKRLEWQRK